MSGLEDRVRALLEPLPDESGGLVVVLAAGARPPALAVLSSGDVHLEAGVVRVALYEGSAAARRLDGGISLLVAGTEEAFRIEAEEASVRRARGLALVEGRVSDIRPTSEPPWVMELRFRPGEQEGDVRGFLDYWRSVRSWLRDGAEPDDVPSPPPSDDAPG